MTNIPAPHTTIYSDQCGESIGVKEGGVLQVELHEVEVRCMPDHLPSSMEVNVDGLAIGDQLLVSDLVVQDGIVHRRQRLK